MKYFVSSLVIGVIGLYAGVILVFGAVFGIRLAIEAAPKFVPAADPVANIQQSDIDFSNGPAVLPDYQLQPAISVLGVLGVLR